MAQTKYYSILFVPDGVENQFGVRLRAWLFKTIIIFFSLLLIGIVFFFSFYGKILMRASQATQLQSENESLKRYKYKLSLLEENMKEARKIVTRISGLAGVDFEIPELPPDSIIFAEMGKKIPAVVQKSYPVNEKLPEGFPVEGYITRGFSDNPDDFHPGIDIAGEIGTPILSTAAGMVTHAEVDSVYGQMVIIEHENNISTLYGHNKEILVEIGQEVLVGSRIALLGNTGKSTAPHLHYEVRENGNPVNPIKYISGYEILNKQN
ncbi:MAG: M23 family metallopeptidase, partial [candidate division Zixibacteria bacterium]|nr:M23 family metallopeptidase [candidate division Zixibacteria bacterium]